MLGPVMEVIIFGDRASALRIDDLRGADVAIVALRVGGFDRVASRLKLGDHVLACLALLVRNRIYALADLYILDNGVGCRLIAGIRRICLGGTAIVGRREVEVQRYATGGGIIKR